MRNATAPRLGGAPVSSSPSRFRLFALPFPAFNPVAVQIGPFAFRWYALAYIVGILLGWWYAKRIVANPKLWGPGGAPFGTRAVDDFIVWGTLGVVLGGRIGYVLFYDLARFAADPISMVAIWEGGMSFHGGFLGVVVAMLVFTSVNRIPFWALLDVAAAVVPFGLFFGRLANFVNGELWGRITDVPWAFVFPAAGPEPRHPSQLYEAALEGLALFLILRFLTHGRKRLTQPGFVSGAFAAWYGFSRVVVEFFREPDAQIGYLAGPLTLGMLLSLPMILAGLGLMLWAARREPAAQMP